MSDGIDASFFILGTFFSLVIFIWIYGWYELTHKDIQKKKNEKRRKTVAYLALELSNIQREYEAIVEERDHLVKLISELKSNEKSTKEQLRIMTNRSEFAGRLLSKYRKYKAEIKKIATLCAPRGLVSVDSLLKEDLELFTKEYTDKLTKQYSE